MAFAAAYDAGDWPFAKPIEVVQKAGEVLYIPTGWHQAHVNLEETVALNVQIATPTHMPLDRDWSAHSDPETGFEWEYNWKTFQVRTDADDEDDEEADGDAAPEEVEEGA